MIAWLLAAPTSSMTEPIRDGGAYGGLVAIAIVVLLLSALGVKS